MEYPLIFQNLIDSLKKLPGVGSKSAERMAYDILNMDEDTIKKFADSILAINSNYDINVYFFDFYTSPASRW